MLAIPYARTYTVTMKARIPKLVRCDRCSGEYVYQAERSAVGKGTSMLFLNNQGAAGTAEAQARARLTADLTKACEAVPCPDCGHVQEHMVPRARERHHAWAVKFCPHFILVAVILSLILWNASSAQNPIWFASPGLILWALLAGAWFGGGVLPIWKYMSSCGYDPNAEDVEDRKQKGKKLAVSRAEFERRHAASGGS